MLNPTCTGGPKTRPTERTRNGKRNWGIFMEKELEPDSLFQVLIKSFYLAFGIENLGQINTGRAQRRRPYGNTRGIGAN